MATDDLIVINYLFCACNIREFPNCPVERINLSCYAKMNSTTFIKHDDPPDFLQMLEISFGNTPIYLCFTENRGAVESSPLIGQKELTDFL